ncbi:MAG: long-chain fatty acid--CoA ligase [Pelovirga sp.]
MTTTTKALPWRSIPHMLRSVAQEVPDHPCISFKRGGGYLCFSYKEFYTRVLMTARGLRKARVNPQDKVAILSENRAGWAIADMGILAARAVSVPIYATSTGHQAAFIIHHSGARIVFISSRQQYEKLLVVREQIPHVDMVISFDRFLGEKSLPVYTLYQLSETSHPITAAEQRDIETHISAISPDDLMTIIYTSGTTGEPKGVMLTHFNVAINAWNCLEHTGRKWMDGTFLSFLPLSHVLERTAGYYAVLMCGSHIAFAESINTVVENINEVKPSAMISVPRLFEKIHSRVYESVHQMSPVRRQLFHFAVRIGRSYVYRRYITHQPTGLLGLQHTFFDWLIFRKIRKKFGGKLRFFISGGAPLDSKINEFMWILGIPVFEGYGLTEASPVVAVNSLQENRFGSVGRPITQTELKLNAKGELLVKGPQVMQGYYRNNELTRQVLADGWLKTGDIARIDEEGYLYIIDRKKEIIVTAGGKNISPQPLENSLKLDKYISQAYLHGDRRPYLVVLLTPNLERLLEYSHQHNISYLGLEDLVANPQVIDLYAERLEQFNRALAPHETIKKFVLLAREFSIEGGELTPTLKLKRKEIYALYQSRIDALYQQMDGASFNHGGLP